MATLVLTRDGFEDIVRTLGRVPPQLWVNCGVLSDQELAELRSAGHDVTHFTKPIDLGSSSAVQHALDVVREHHPLQRIWVEYPPGSPKPTGASARTETVEHVEVLQDWPRPSSVGEASINACRTPLLISYRSQDGKLAVIEVHLCDYLIYGHPNDEVLESHPLFGNGLDYYTAHRVNNSKLVSELEARNASHPRHDKAEFLSGKEHYIITFQDATLEFVAKNTPAFPLKVHVFDSAEQAATAFFATWRDDSFNR